MRILLLNQFYPPDTAATGQLLADVAAGLAAAGHEVHIICSKGGYGGGRIQQSAGTPAGVHVHRVAAFKGGRTGAVERLLAWASYYVLALWTALRVDRFEACLCLTTPPFIGLVGVALKRLRGTRLTLWLMDVWPDVAEELGTLRPGGAAARVFGGIAQVIYRHADRIVSLGPCMSERLARRNVPPQKVVEVHNWVPGESVAPLPFEQAGSAELVDTPGRLTVMYSGNMGLAHEFETILDAAAAAEEDQDEMRFCFVGHGKRRSEIETAVDERQLSNVTFMEPVPLEHLSVLLGSAHCHLVSMREGVQGLIVPSKIYGILAAGRPVIFVGPEESGPARLVRQSGAGYLVRPDDSTRLRAVLAEMSADPALAAELGRRARDYYETHLGRSRSVRRVVDAVAGGA